jgi:hypothetical protein
LCINRALSLGPWYRFFSGLGVATADALAGGIAARSISLVSQFLVKHQFAFRLVGGLFFVTSLTKSNARIQGKAGANKERHCRFRHRFVAEYLTAKFDIGNA